MSRRKKRITTKNTHSVTTKQKVSNSSEMKRIETEQMGNIKGQKIGLNFAIKFPGYSKPFTGAGVYQLDGFNELHSTFVKNLNETNTRTKLNESEIRCCQILIYQFINNYIEENYDGEGVKCNDQFTTQVVEFCMSLAMFSPYVQEKTDGSYNKYLTLQMSFTEMTNENQMKVSVDWDVHPTFEEFSNKGQELIRVINPNYENVSIMYNEDIMEDVNQILEDVDDFELDDIEPIDYSVDDIEIVDDAVVPIMGVKYEVLLKLKNSMTILEIGQTIKIPKDERLRSTIYQLNKKYFPNKRFSVVQLADNFIVFLNPNRKDRINQL